MPYICRSCNFFDEEGTHSSTCPECEGPMRFTMLDPRPASAVGAGGGAATAVAEPRAEKAAAKKADWSDTYKYGYEEIEATWSFRYAQIGLGISSYFVISYVLVPFILVPFAFAFSGIDPAVAGLAIVGMAFFLYCLAALGGGAVAGFWVRNWLPQGLGVAAGVMFVPLLFLLCFAPESWPLFVARLVLTSGMTIVGAFVGHVVVKPTRIVRS